MDAKRNRCPRGCFDPDQFHDPEFRSLVRATRAVIAERVHRGVASPPERLAVAALDERDLIGSSSRPEPVGHRGRHRGADPTCRLRGRSPSLLCPARRGPVRLLAGNGNQKRDLCGHVKWDPQVLRQNIKFWALLAKECSWAVGQALPVTVRAGGVKAVSPAERGRSVATRLDAGEHTVMLIGPTARVVDAR